VPELPAGGQSGSLRFARYAYPPNELGYCGPDLSRQLLEQVAAGVDDGDLRRIARGFDGAWPYLRLIAGANGIADPLDARVVEAYWVGNELLTRVSPQLMGSSLESRFRGRVGSSWSRLSAPVSAGALPHHSFHVFGVYPWVGLLREGQVDAPLRVLDRCRVRWGKVLSTSGGLATVRFRPLTWDGRCLGLGLPVVEKAMLSTDDLGLAGPVAPGDWVSLHWEWVCERLDSRALAALRGHTLRELRLVNSAAVPAPAAVLS
jgi:Family of unknown function (DUF6390)